MVLVSLNVKSEKSKKLFLVIFMLVLAVLTIFAVSNNAEKENKASADYSTAAAREFFLNLNKLDASEISQQKITIPKEFTQKYSEYSEMQSKAGFELDKYKGKSAMLYTYEVKNYEDSENVRASLIVCGDKIIAADIYSYEQNGFFCALEAKC